MFSYPKPTQITYPPFESLNPRPLHAISPPKAIPDHVRVALPRAAAQRTQAPYSERVIPGYTLSTHVFPAASPRSKCDTGPTPLFPFSDPNRKSKVTAATEQLAALRDVNAEVVYEEDWPEQPLWMVVNRFTSQRLFQGYSEPKQPRVTMTFMHANGFHKETWEEAIKAAVFSSKEFGLTVDEMWFFDSVNHGDSALLNEGRLGTICRDSLELLGNADGYLVNWQDNARDLLNFLLHYLPQSPGGILPVYLEPISTSESTHRATRGFSHRILVACGHSLGGVSTCRAALHMPQLFSDVLPIDPVIYAPFLHDAIAAASLPLVATVSRRVDWASREEAMRSLLQLSFFNKWDRKVLEAYVDHAMFDDDEGRIRLKTSGYQEAAVFAERRVAREVWELLPQMDERVELHWIMSGMSGVGEEEDMLKDIFWRRELTVWRRPVNASNIRMKGSGHLIVQTVPHSLGVGLAAYVTGKYAKNNAFISKL